MNPPSELSSSDNTRQAILDAAYSLFTTQGFHGTSMRQIASQATLALGGIYNHFASKEEIFEAMLIHFHPVVILSQRMEQEQELDQRYPSYIHQIGYAAVELFEKHQGILQLAFIEFLEFKGRHIPQMVEEIYPRAMAFARRFQRLQKGLRELPAPLIMASCMGMFLGYLFFSFILKLTPVGSQIDFSVDDMADVLMYGMIERPDKGREL